MSPVAISITCTSLSPTAVMSPTVAAGPVRWAVNDVPVVDALTISTAFL